MFGVKSDSMSTRGLAAVFHEVGRPLELRTSDLPELDAGEALVKITCATVCGSDVHTMRGARPVGEGPEEPIRPEGERRQWRLRERPYELHRQVLA